MENEREKPKPALAQASGPYGHLIPNGPKQSAEWTKRESDRRAGRNRKDWWKKDQPGSS